MPRGGVRGNSGGKKGRSGRKSKAEEMGLQALLAECWTEADRKACIRALAERAKKGIKFDMEAVKLLMAYAYGRPVERKEVTGADGSPLIPEVVTLIDKVYGDDGKKSA